MTRKERLLRTLCGEPVDRPPVCFYEINGFDEDPTDPDPFNVYNHPSWEPLLTLTRDKTDRIVMRTVPFLREANAIDRLTRVTSYYDENGSRHTVTEITAGDRVLRQHTRRDPAVNTLWTLEHFLKDDDDLQAWLDLPHSDDIGTPDYRAVLQTEQALGDTGIVMLDTGDALCEVASLFSMEDYTITAMMSPELFTQALELIQRTVLAKIQRVAQDLPGRLWRIYGPEYATPPYLPPRLYHDYVVRFDSALVEAIQALGGFARIHQHGNLRDVLAYAVETGCTAIDPIEPTPQGDVTLAEVREKYGDQLVLFGNLEISDIEQVSQSEMEEKVRVALREGTGGKGFVLMPSSAPYGREISEVTLRNYRTIVALTEAFSQTR